jgi:formate-dependent nitrite reductase membrane component NrfD
MYVASAVLANITSTIVMLLPVTIVFLSLIYSSQISKFLKNKPVARIVLKTSVFAAIGVVALILIVLTLFYSGFWD